MSARAGRRPAKGQPKKYIALENKRFTSFPPASQITNTLALSLGKNPLTSFTGLPTSDILQKLVLSDTKVESFEGATEQPHLTTLSLERTPLGAEKHVIEMALIVFGSQLQIVSGIQVTPHQREYADAARPNLRNWLTTGWILTSLRPAKILHKKSRVRKAVYIDFDSAAAAAAAARAAAKEAEDAENQQDSIAERIRRITASNSTLQSSALRLSLASDDDDSDGGPELDALLADMVALSREWNKKMEDPDEVQPKEKEDEIFKTANAAAQNNSVVRLRKSMRWKQGPTDTSPPRRTIGSPTRSPERKNEVQRYEEKYPYLLQKLEGIRDREKRKKGEEPTEVVEENLEETDPTSKTALRAVDRPSPVVKEEEREDEPKKLSKLEELYRKRAPRMETRVKFAEDPVTPKQDLSPKVELSRGRRRTVGATPLVELVGRPLDEEEEKVEKVEKEPPKRIMLSRRSNSQAIFDMVQQMMADPRGAPANMKEMVRRTSTGGLISPSRSNADEEKLVLSPKSDGGE